MITTSETALLEPVFEIDDIVDEDDLTPMMICSVSINICGPKPPPPPDPTPAPDPTPSVW